MFYSWSVKYLEVENFKSTFCCVLMQCEPFTTQGCKQIEQRFGFIYLFLKLFKFGLDLFITDGVYLSLVRLFLKVFKLDLCLIYLN